MTSHRLDGPTFLVGCTFLLLFAMVYTAAIKPHLTSSNDDDAVSATDDDDVISLWPYDVSSDDVSNDNKVERHRVETRRYRSYRGDLGKRAVHWYGDEGGVNEEEDDDDSAGVESVAKRRSKLRGDLGKRRKAGFRGDLGRRSFN
jgi:hypothetical protein